jgi:exodeoxyribonuclease VII small subunit
MKEKISYTDAFEELQIIVAEMEKGEITVDQLSEKVQRAAVLIQVCKEKLTSTELDVRKILRELNQKDEAEDIKSLS